MTNGSGKPNHLQEFVMTANERDLELCSGGEEDEYLEVEVHSPTDSSEDSVEVKVSPICLRNKRKAVEPRKVQDAYTAPLKKRMCLQAKHENSAENPEPFRPWSVDNHRPPSPKADPSKELRVPLAGLPISINGSPAFTSLSVPTDVKPAEPNFVIPQVPHQPPFLPPTTILQNGRTPAYIRPASPGKKPPSPSQPLPLVKKPREKKTKTEIIVKTESEPNCDTSNLRVPLHPHMGGISTQEAEELLISSAEAFPKLQTHIKEEQRKEQRNYKNMTRERRIEANARERTRVHTISAAFETLRRAVPSYSHNQKLSKLSVLRIACSYIMTLSTLVGDPAATEIDPQANLAECVDNVSKTIQKEGKLRKKKDDVE